MSLVYLVYQMPNGRAWYTGEELRVIENSPVYFPRFDDERGKQVSLEFALEARKRWREDPRIRIETHIALEKYGQFIDEDREAPSTGRDDRDRVFVPFTNTNGLGLIASPGRTPDGPCWYIRAADIPAFQKDGRHTAVESVSGPTPQAAAQAAFDRFGPQILFEDPDAKVRAAQQARERAEQEKNRHFVNLRPADRGPR